MRQAKLLAALAVMTTLLAACGGQPETKTQPAQPAAPAQAAAPTEVPKATVAPTALVPAVLAPAVEAPGASKTIAKPVFIDFYAPW